MIVYYQRRRRAGRVRQQKVPRTCIPVFCRLSGLRLALLASVSLPWKAFYGTRYCTSPSKHDVYYAIDGRYFEPELICPPSGGFSARSSSPFNRFRLASRAHNLRWPLHRPCTRVTGGWYPSHSLRVHHPAAHAVFSCPFHLTRASDFQGRDRRGRATDAAPLLMQESFH